jgi:hypothetical protein
VVIIGIRDIGVDRISKLGVPGAWVTMFGGSAYEVLFIYRNRLHYTTENNCQKVGVPGHPCTNGNYAYDPREGSRSNRLVCDNWFFSYEQTNKTWRLFSGCFSQVKTNVLEFVNGFNCGDNAGYRWLKMPLGLSSLVSSCNIYGHVLTCCWHTENIISYNS